jgi:hypothetical protein
MKDLNFAKVMILLCLIGSGVLAWLDWNQHKQIGQLKLALQPGGDVEQLVRSTQQAGKEYAELSRALKGDELKSQDRPLSYISDIADEPLISIGQVDIRVNDRKGRGTIDHVYSISPQNKDRFFSKLNIANFLFTLEEKSRKVRVTQLDMDQINSNEKTRVRATEFPADLFTFSTELTSRQRAE